MKSHLGIRRGFLLTTLVLAIMSIMQSSCNSTTDVVINRAHAIFKATPDRYEVYASIGRHDVSKIVDGEIYSYVVVFNCGRSQPRYPIEPNIEGVPLRRFSQATSQLNNSNSTLIELNWGVPVEVMRRFNRPCVTMDGGSYLGRALRSNVVPLQLP